ncbi:hypothetical protein [Leucobacter aridicollis]|uniref:Uncharacterized protein n=1 Tax=Leucobacter aridicollis TaxID=283878 RepID=A0A852QUA0_9MICO|nr:hypothetical protein [Leucobacter aridicollis]MBL3682427.1 hypothetical protein [Leucobacter aridicollis]NYD25843.1 hypothetical protein [Leucobacter aridicollis]
MQPTSRLPHVVRGSTAAAVATFVALFSHVLAGGAMPEPLGICVPFVLSLLVSVLLAGRKLSLTRLSLSVIASQTLFHTLFVLGAPSAGGAGPAAAGGHQHHGQTMTAAMAPAQGASVPAMTDHTAMLIQGDAVMWLSHLVGAAVTILFLYRGEQTIHRLRELAERFIAWAQHGLAAALRVPAVFGAPVQRQAEPIETAGWAVLTQLIASTRSLRGPPAVPGLAS